MMTRRGLTLLAALLMGMGSLAAHAQDITVQHAQGETTVPLKPAEVFSFDLAALDTLAAIGVEVAGVPSGTKPGHLAAYDTPGHLTIGTLFEPDYELINAEQPDLVIVGGRSAPKYGELSRLAPTIDLTTDNRDFVGSAIANAETLGRIFGREAEVAERVAALQGSIADLKQVAADAGKGLLILTTGGRMSAYGPGSRFGAIHTAFGVSPAVAELSTATHGQPISFEFILETNPDWLFVIDRDAAIGREGEAARQLLDNDIVRQTTAWQKGQVVYLNAANWYLAGGGLTALQDNVDEIAAALSAR